jgi:hypothetical protein
MTISNDFLEGKFRFVFIFHGKSTKDVSFLFGEEVLKIKRKCSSLTSWFPSGILTIFSYILLAKAVRHEYSIIETTNYTILIEVGTEQLKSKTEPVIWVKIKSKKLKSPDEAEKEFEEETNKYWCRSLCTIQDKELYKMNFSKIIGIIQIFIIIARQNGGYDILDANCKCLARSILYFYKSDFDCDYVLYSLIGCFTDKPLLIPHVDMILIEKTIINLFKIIPSEKSKYIQLLKDGIEKLRNI